VDLSLFREPEKYAEYLPEFKTDLESLPSWHLYFLRDVIVAANLLPAEVQLVSYNIVGEPEVEQPKIYGGEPQLRVIFTVESEYTGLDKAALGWRNWLGQSPREISFLFIKKEPGGRWVAKVGYDRTLRDSPDRLPHWLSEDEVEMIRERALTLARAWYTQDLVWHREDYAELCTGRMQFNLDEMIAHAQKGDYVAPRVESFTLEPTVYMIDYVNSYRGKGDITVAVAPLEREVSNQDEKIWVPKLEPVGLMFRWDENRGWLLQALKRSVSSWPPEPEVTF